MTPPRRHSRSGNGTNARHGLRGLRVLVVDDAVLDLKLMRVLLAAEGCELRTARDVAGALTELAAFQPLVLVIDVLLPGGDSLELVRRLKAAPATAAIAVLAISASNHQADARAAGCDEFVAKPIDVETFADTLRALLRRAAKRSGG